MTEENSIKDNLIPFKFPHSIERGDPATAIYITQPWKTFIIDWLNTNCIFQNGGYMWKKEIKTTASVFNSLTLDLDTRISSIQNTKEKAKWTTQKLIVEAFYSSLISSEIDLSQQKLAASIKNVDGMNLDPLKSFISNLHIWHEDPVDGPDLTLRVFYNWIWNAKRAFLQIDGYTDPNFKIWINLMAEEQGNFKSQATSFLVMPLLKNFAAANVSLNDILNSSIQEDLFSKNTVLRLDEFKGANKQQLEYLKSLATEKTITARKLYSSIATNVPINSFFISSSNRPISEIMPDSSGGRRFFEIRQAVPQGKMLAEELFKYFHEDNIEEAYKIWQGVDENSPSIFGYDDYLKIQQTTQAIAKDNALEMGGYGDFISENLELATDKIKMLTSTEIWNKYHDTLGYKLGTKEVTLNQQSKLLALYFGKKLEKTRTNTSRQYNLKWKSGVRNV
jgi:hypothetical protein